MHPLHRCVVLFLLLGYIYVCTPSFGPVCIPETRSEESLLGGGSGSQAFVNIVEGLIRWEHQLVKNNNASESCCCYQKASAKFENRMRNVLGYTLLWLVRYLVASKLTDVVEETARRF
ncbi:hypothetical protein QR680_000512 [Steinernema hermaphroditum]|uniref:Transmembrane protein n=1 Tax=Steinernema hermaphroditum TaxID=289476 RepID=A0AA39GUU5_9BILA|nr:hypothetical protein QR680_000512 [Steinernema hermaphroditum]